MSRTTCRTPGGRRRRRDRSESPAPPAIPAARSPGRARAWRHRGRRRLKASTYRRTAATFVRLRHSDSSPVVIRPLTSRPSRISSCCSYGATTTVSLVACFARRLAGEQKAPVLQDAYADPDGRASDSHGSMIRSNSCTHRLAAAINALLRRAHTDVVLPHDVGMDQHGCSRGGRPPRARRSAFAADRALPAAHRCNASDRSEKGLRKQQFSAAQRPQHGHLLVERNAALPAATRDAIHDEDSSVGHLDVRLVLGVPVAQLLVDVGVVPLDLARAVAAPARSASTDRNSNSGSCSSVTAGASRRANASMTLRTTSTSSALTPASRRASSTAAGRACPGPSRARG